MNAMRFRGRSERPGWASAAAARRLAAAAVSAFLPSACAPAQGTPQATAPREAHDVTASASHAAAAPGDALELLPHGGDPRSSRTEVGPRESSGRDCRVDALLDSMAKTRGLAPKSAVRAQTLERDALGAALRAHVDRDLPPDILRNQGEFLIGLGLVPPAFAYEDGAYGLIQSQLAGFYEPFDKTMYLISDLGWNVAEFTLAHELVHALQDQHFELGSRFTYQPESNDLSSAVQALAEGDATSAAMDMLLARRGPTKATDLSDDELTRPLEGSMSAPDLASVPYVLRASLIAPYVDGVRFVHALRRSGGWQAVNAAWRSPPTTTEQVLHPDKFASRETGIRVATPPPPPRGRWSVAYADVFGEEGLRIALEGWISHPSGAELAEGWGGDKTVLYREVGQDDVAPRVPAPFGTAAPSSTFAAAWRVRFDLGAGPDPHERSSRMFTALFRGLRGTMAPDRMSFCHKLPGIGALVVARSQDEVVVVSGPYERSGAQTTARSNCQQGTSWASRILATPGADAGGAAK